MTIQQQQITAGQIAGSVAARILANKGVVSDGSEYTQGPGVYHAMVHEYPDSLVQLDDEPMLAHEYPELALQQTKDLADEIIDQLTDEQVMAFREQMRQQEE